MTKFDLGDREIMIVNTGRHFYAADTWCTHQRSDLSMGILTDTLVMCPLHQARFDIRDGHVEEGPSGESATSIPPLAIYAVKIEGGNILIKLPA